MKKQALICVAHGDDETNGAGATILRLREVGWDVSILYGTLPAAEPAQQVRRAECEAAAMLFGATAFIWDEPDGKLEDSLRTRQKMADLYADIGPDLVIGLHGLDVHPDHRAMSSLALGPAMQRGVNVEYFSMELCSSGRHTESDRPQTLGFLPTHYVDMKDLSTKVAEITRAHASQDPEAMILGMQRVHTNRAIEAGWKNTTAEAFVRMTRTGPLQHGLEQIFTPSSLSLPRPIGVDFTPEIIGL